MGILSQNETLGLVGGGTMAQSIMFPLFDKCLIEPESVIISSRTQATLDIWEKYGCRTSLDNGHVVEKADIVIWAVKPQVFVGAVEGISKNLNGKVLNAGALHISIMAGVPLEMFSSQIKTAFSVSTRCYNFRTIRVMPNIGLAVSCGVAVYACGPDAVDYDKNLIRNMLQPLGLCYECQESQINAYCGLFGSGIGFMFPIMEGLSDGAVRMGIPRANSLEIIAQVFKGAGELYLKNKTHPGTLKDMVCSPGGTTIAGITAMERGGVRAAMINAIEAATIRGQELGTATTPIPTTLPK